MMETKIIISKYQSLLFQNLLALGFDISLVEQEHKIKFDKKIFCLPNQKAFEVMSYFLFCKLNEVSSKKYVIAWPLLDVKAHREYYKTCFNHLSSIAQESSIRFPLVSSSVLSSYGEPFYELFFAFSTHVISVTNKCYDTPIFRRPKTDNKFHEETVKIMQMITTICVRKFIDVAELSKHFLNDCFKCSNNLVSSINKLKMLITTNNSLLKERIKTLSNTYLASSENIESQSIESITQNCMKHQNRVKQYVDYLEQFFSKENKLWSFVSSELDEGDSKLLFSGSGFDSCIPTIIHEKQSEKLEINYIEENTHLCIYRCLQLFVIALKLYSDRLKKSSLIETDLYDSFEKVYTIEKYMKKLTYLNTILLKRNKMDRSHVEEMLHNLDGPIENLFKIKLDLPPSLNTVIRDKNYIEDFNKLVHFETSFTDIDQEILDCEIKLERKDDFNIEIDARINDCPKLEPFDSEMTLNSKGYDEEKVDKEFCIEHSVNMSIHKQPTDKFIKAKEMNSTENKDTTSTHRQIFTYDLNSYLPPSFDLEESLNSQSLSDVSFLD